MSRYNFQTDKSYAAKLVRVAPRPIENSGDVQLSLVRLEFAIYWRYPEKNLLESHGEFACRDLIVGSLVPADRDLGLVNYAVALCVAAPITSPENWAALIASERFIELQFGPPESEGGRNPFTKIAYFDSSGWTVEEYKYDKTSEWVTIRVAADAVGVSESTVRRRVDALEEEWGTRLIVRTEGTHRRIHLPMFTNIWND